MHFWFFFTAFDASLGKVDKRSLSQQTLMELFISKMTFTKEIIGDDESITDISTWSGLLFGEDNPTQVTDLYWNEKKLKGEIPFEWLPHTVCNVVLDLNDLSGTVDLTCLPDVLSYLGLSHNRFEGKVDLTKLPPVLNVLYLNDNDFHGLTDFSLLPESLWELDVSSTKLEGEVYKLGGNLLIQGSNVKDRR